MRTRSLTLIGSTPAVANDAYVDAAIQCWCEKDRPDVVSTTLERVLGDPCILDHSAVVWIALDEANPNRLFQLVGSLQDRDLSAMLTQPGETNPLGTSFQSGIVIAPMNAGPQALCSTLRTLWNQAAVVRSLKIEVEMLQVHHDGLCDQIDKIDEELRLAAKLQREFLPEKPLIGPNIQFKVLYRPAGYVSGDIYDMMHLDDDHVGFFIADAAGHGVPAALMTMYIKRSLHTKEEDLNAPGCYRIVPPNEAIARLNNDMVRQHTGKTGIATACYGVLNCKTMDLSLARAGHPFPLLLHADGSVSTLEPDGMLLGVFPDNKYERIRRRLEPGDRLILYSDGFEMAFPELNDGEPDPNKCPANDQYIEEFKDLANGPIDQAMRRLQHKLDQQVGSLNQRDDLTVLCLCIANPSDPPTEHLSKSIAD